MQGFGGLVAALGMAGATYFLWGGYSPFPRGWLWACLALAGGAAWLRAAKGGGEHSSLWSAKGWILGASVVGLALPSWARAAGVLGLGWGLLGFLALGSPRRWVRQGRDAAATLLVLLWSQWLLMVPLSALLLRYRFLPLGKLFALLLRFSGIQATGRGSELFLADWAFPFHHTITAEGFGLPWLLPFLASSWLLFRLSGEKGWGLPLRLLALTLVFALVRHLALLLWMAQARGMEPVWFWHPSGVALSLGVLALWLGLWPWPSPEPPPPLPSKMRASGLPWMAGAASFLLGMALLYEEPGRRKEGRVWFDERLSSWEWTTQRLGPSEYGEKSMYNYWCLYELLSHYYIVRRNLTRPYTGRWLEEVDVLIIKTPTQPFSSEEVRALLEFVRRGGGLWLIGEHTNFAGSADALNTLAKPLGLRFNADATYDLLTRGLSRWRPPPLLVHPIASCLPRRGFGFLTSCTLGANWRWRSVLVGPFLRTLPADYSRRSFFPDPASLASRENYLWGPFLQCAAASLGRGRIVAFTDSTVFSNFALPMAGHAELALATVEFLNRRNGLWTLGKPWWLGLALLALLGSGGQAWRRGGLVALGSGAAGGMALCLAMVSALPSLPTPPPLSPLHTIAFVTRYSHMAVSDFRFLGPSDEPYNFNSFFLGAQRIGLFPRLCASLPEALALRPCFLVFINPTQPLSLTDQTLLRHFLRRGGGLLLLYGNLRPPTTLRPASPEARAWETMGLPSVLASRQQAVSLLLRSFGLVPSFEDSPSAGLRVSPRQGCSLSPSSTAEGLLFPSYAPAALEGGRPWIWRADGRAAGACVSIGKGTLLAFADAWLFCSRVMGEAFSLPQPWQRRIGDLEFLLLEHLHAHAHGRSQSLGRGKALGCELWSWPRQVKRRRKDEPHRDRPGQFSAGSCELLSRGRGALRGCAPLPNPQPGSVRPELCGVRERLS